MSRIRVGIETKMSFKFICDLKEGDSWTLWNGYIIVASPKRPPHMISLADGSVQVIEPKPPVINARD